MKMVVTMTETNISMLAFSVDDGSLTSPNLFLSEQASNRPNGILGRAMKESARRGMNVNSVMICGAEDLPTGRHCG